MIKLITGNILDSKCDLLIVPCNSVGGISPSLQQDLYFHNLPYSTGSIEVGEVSFITDVNGFTNASAIGFAATVDHHSDKSSVDYLKTIAQQIKFFCIENALTKVNMPLLGTGAGGLSPVQSFQVFFDEFNNNAEILLCIHSLTREISCEIDEAFTTKSSNSTVIKNPRVFISYAQSSGSSKSWVKAFATRLRQNGVDARLDVFHLRPGQDLPQWMTNEIILADKVLLICDQYYAEKADTNKGGVGWENMIIRGDMLTNQTQEKYIAIIREEGLDKSLPTYIRSKLAIDWTQYADGKIPDEAFKELLIYLFDCDVASTIGPIPSYIYQLYNGAEV